MEKLSNTLNFSRLERVISGPGSVQQIGAELDQRGLKRVLVVTGRTLGASPLLETVKRALGERCVGIFAATGEHVPAASIRAIVEEIRRTGADTLVSFGGGSPNDAAKAAIGSILTDRDVTAEVSQKFFDHEISEQKGRLLFHICLPTTLSAGEYHDDTAGFTDDAGVKRGFVDPRMGPGVIINDAELCDATPDDLWVTTGIRALDHCVEGLYSARGDNFTDALAKEAMQLLLKYLPTSNATGDIRTTSRAFCQTAACLSNYAAANTRYGPSHFVSAAVGTRWHIPHGVTSVIALPSAMRFMAGEAPERFGAIADIMEVDASLGERERAFAASDAIERFIASVTKPRTLREYGVEKEDLAGVAAMVHGYVVHAGTTGHDITVDPILKFIEACW